MIKRGPYAIGLAGSGTVDFITYVAQELPRRLPETAALDFDGVRMLLGDICREIGERYIEPDTGRRDLSIDLLAGIKIGPVMPRLLKVGAALPPMWVDIFTSVGCGGELAHYLLDGWYDVQRKPDVRQGIVLVAHVLKAVKKYASACGGESDIIRLKEGLTTAFVPADDISQHEQSAAGFAAAVKPVLVALTDIGVSNERLDQMIGEMTIGLHAIRTVRFTQQQLEKAKTKVPTVTFISREDTSS